MNFISIRTDEDHLKTEQFFYIQNLGISKIRIFANLLKK